MKSVTSQPQRADEYLHVARVYSSEQAELRQECLRKLFVEELEHLPVYEKDQHVVGSP